MSNNMMSLSINKEMLTPVIEQQVKAMMAEILGGKEAIADQIITKILKAHVDSSGHFVSYNSNTTYLDWLIKDELSKAVKSMIREEVVNNTSKVKEKIRKAIQSEKNSTIIADSLLNGLHNTMNNAYTSTFKIEIQNRND